MRRESSCESRDGGGYKFAPTGCYRSVGGRNLAANAPNRGRRTARLFRASRDRAISIFVLSACTFVSSSKWYVCTSKDRGYSDSRGFQLSLSLWLDSNRWFKAAADVGTRTRQKFRPHRTPDRTIVGGDGGAGTSEISELCCLL